MGIGFREINPDFAKEKSLNVQEGIYVGEVYNRSAAMEAGIKEGDIITAVNGVKIKNAATMQEQMSRYRPGDKIKVTILRNNQNKELALTLKNSQGNTEVTKLAGIDSLGAGFKELSDKTKRELNIGNGVQVIGIKNGKFKDAGIREGFVILEINDTPIRSISNIEEMFDNITKSNNDRKVMFITGISER
ncbi:MAG: PDZ domain-containing protein [Barnesiella sp.]